MGNENLSSGIPLGGAVYRTNPGDSNATHDSRYGKGGFAVVDDIAARDSIHPNLCRHHMERKVIDTGITYGLKPTYNFLAPPTPADWYVVSSENGFVFSDDFIDLYVSTLGDDNNDGSAGFPFATIQKALFETGRYRTTKSIRIFVEAGAYTASSPNNLLFLSTSCISPVLVLGNNDGFDPALTTIDCSGGLGFVNSGTNANLLMSGFTLNNTNAPFFLQDCPGAKIGNNVVNNSTSLILSAVEAGNVQFVQGYGAGTYSLNGNPGTISCAVAFGTTLDVGGSPTFTGFDECLRASGRATISTTFGTTVTMDGRVGGALGCVSLKDNSNGFLYANMDCDNQVVTANNWGVEVQGSTLATLSGSNYNFNNSKYGLLGVGQYQIISPDANWTYTNVDRPAVMGCGGTYFSPDNFDTDIILDDIDDYKHGYQRHSFYDSMKYG